MILTPIVLKKLNEVPLEVSLWNGNFNKCVVDRTINRRNYRIVVKDTHPMLQLFVMPSVIEEPVEVWYNYCKVNYQGNPIPEELLPLIDKMKAVCKMQDGQAKQVYADMVNCARRFRKEFYGE